MPGSAAALAALASIWLFGAGPAGAEVSHPGGVSEMCPEVLRGAPTGGLKKVTEPPDGTEVQGGDTIKVKLQWDESRFDGSSVHKALDCVTIDGELAPDLSVEERKPANDGVFEHTYTVPDGLPEGTRVCDRGFVSGPGGDGEFNREKSNDVCFTVGAPVSGGGAEAPAPAPAPPAPAPPAPAPPAPAPAPPTPPVTLGPAGGPAPPLVSAAPTPVPAAGQVVAPRPPQALPRTGSDNRGLALVAAGALLSGALSLVARSDRPTSRLSRR